MKFRVKLLLFFGVFVSTCYGMAWRTPALETLIYKLGHVNWQGSEEAQKLWILKRVGYGFQGDSCGLGICAFALMALSFRHLLILCLATGAIGNFLMFHTDFIGLGVFVTALVSSCLLTCLLRYGLILRRKSEQLKYTVTVTSLCDVGVLVIPAMNFLTSVCSLGVQTLPNMYVGIACVCCGFVVFGTTAADYSQKEFDAEDAPSMAYALGRLKQPHFVLPLSWLVLQIYMTAKAFEFVRHLTYAAVVDDLLADRLLTMLLPFTFVPCFIFGLVVDKFAHYIMMSVSLCTMLLFVMFLQAANDNICHIMTSPLLVMSVAGNFTVALAYIQKFCGLGAVPLSCTVAGIMCFAVLTIDDVLTHGEFREFKSISIIALHSVLLVLMWVYLNTGKSVGLPQDGVTQ